MLGSDLQRYNNQDTRLHRCFGGQARYPVESERFPGLSPWNFYEIPKGKQIPNFNNESSNKNPKFGYWWIGYYLVIVSWLMYLGIYYA